VHPKGEIPATSCGDELGADVARAVRPLAHDLLAPILRWFTEGFDTLDLKQAKAFLMKFIRCSALLLTPDGGYDLVKRPLQWRAHGPALVRVATTRSNPAGWAAPGASPVQFRLLRTCCIAAKPRAATG
jgi:hypothetical protein